MTLTQQEAQNLKKRMKDLLERIRDAKGFSGYNRGFRDRLKRNDKYFGLIGKLPVSIEEESEICEKRIVANQIAMLLHLIRPVVYCFSQLYFSQRSYKPYFISIMIDIIRLLLLEQSRIKFTSLFELQEFKKMNKDILINYLLQRPFYTEMLRNKILDPLLDCQFPKLPFVGKIIIYLFELRSSRSLLM